MSLSLHSDSAMACIVFRPKIILHSLSVNRKEMVFLLVVVTSFAKSRSRSPVQQNQHFPYYRPQRGRSWCCRWCFTTMDISKYWAERSPCVKWLQSSQFYGACTMSGTTIQGVKRSTVGSVVNGCRCSNSWWDPPLCLERPGHDSDIWACDVHIMIPRWPVWMYM